MPHSLSTSEMTFQLKKRQRSLAVSTFFIIVALFSHEWARGDLYFSVAEGGRGTTISFMGSIDTSNLASLDKVGAFNGFNPTKSLLSSGAVPQASFTGYITPSTFTLSTPGMFPAIGPSAANGDFVSVHGSLTNPGLVLPHFYVSGAAMAGSSLYGGTVSSIGLDVTPFDYDLGNGEIIHFWHTTHAPSSDGPSDAILQATRTSGAAVPNALQRALTSAPQTALNTVSNRLFFARSQVGNPRSNGGGLVSSASPNSSFFNFSRKNGINLAQALGFEDIPVAAAVKDSDASFVLRGLTIETQIGATITPEAKRWEIYTGFDYLSFDQDNIGFQPGFDADTFTGTVGAEYHVNEKLNVGLAYSYLDNQTKLGGNLGRVDVEGHLATAYATYFWDNNYVDLLYSRANFENSLMRNVPGGTTLGTPDSIADTVNLNLGKNIDLGNGLMTGPIAGLDYTHGNIEAYTETGPAAAILAYQAQSYESLITRLGWQASKTQDVECGRLTLQGSLAWEKENMPTSSTVNAALVSFPTLPFNLSNGAHAGTDWLNLTLGASLMTRSGVEVGLNYQSQLFRSDVTSHYLGAKVAVKF